ncbi:transposase [Pasteuria penetrans]|uniref:transposase n=1 Tax=Pasteuria penetrans TaxID=86005 RepID=UPI000F93CC6E|nr:transposase [Pasteuria penetrans]
MSTPRHCTTISRKDNPSSQPLFHVSPLQYSYGDFIASGDPTQLKYIVEEAREIENSPLTPVEQRDRVRKVRESLCALSEEFEREGAPPSRPNDRKQGFEQQQSKEGEDPIAEKWCPKPNNESLKEQKEENNAKKGGSKAQGERAAVIWKRDQKLLRILSTDAIYGSDDITVSKEEREIASHLAKAAKICLGDNDMAVRMHQFITTYPKQSTRMFLSTFIRTPLTNHRVDDIEEEFCTNGLKHAIELGLCFEQWYNHGMMPGNSRNGFTIRERNGLKIRIPQLREAVTTQMIGDSGILGYRDLKLVEGSWIRGISFQSISELLYEARGIEISPSTLKSHIQPLYNRLDSFGNQDLSGYKCFGIMLDASYDHTDIITHKGKRKKKRKRGKPVLTALGIFIDDEGIKLVYLGCKSVDSESTDNYALLVGELVKWGFSTKNVELMLSDRHRSFAGLRDKIFPQAKLHYCGVHLTRNLGKKIPKCLKGPLGSVFLKAAYWVLKGTTKEEVWERFGLLKSAPESTYGSEMKDAIEYLCVNIESHTNVVKFFSNPEIIRVLLNTNRIESMNRLISRWADWKGGFRSTEDQERAAHIAGLRMEKSPFIFPFKEGDLIFDEEISDKEKCFEFRIGRVEKNCRSLMEICIKGWKGDCQELGNILASLAKQTIECCNGILWIRHNQLLL